MLRSSDSTRKARIEKQISYFLFEVSIIYFFALDHSLFFVTRASTIKRAVFLHKSHKRFKIVLLLKFFLIRAPIQVVVFSRFFFVRPCTRSLGIRSCVFPFPFLFPSMSQLGKVICTY